MDRYQVKVPAKKWGDAGPDLLRTKESTKAQVHDLLDQAGRWNWRKQTQHGEWFEWRVLGNRQDVLDWLDSALHSLGNGQLAQIGLSDTKGDPDPRVVIRGCNVVIPDLSGATSRAEMTHGLVRYRFPDIKFAGCFVCKQISGSSSYSDHAWGDAVDETENPGAGVHNDDVTDWCIRMGAADLMPIVQVLGSVNGKVVNAEARNGWDIRPGGADDTHKWHVHMSNILHDGTPPCAR